MVSYKAVRARRCHFSTNYDFYLTLSYTAVELSLDFFTNGHSRARGALTEPKNTSILILGTTPAKKKREPNILENYHTES